MWPISDRMCKHILKHYITYWCMQRIVVVFSCTVVVQHFRQEHHRAKGNVLLLPDLFSQGE